MSAVDPNVRFRRLAQVTGIRAVMRDREMLVVPARVGTGPPDNGQVVEGYLKRWPFDDLNVLSPLRRRKYLSNTRAERECTT